MNCYNFPNYSIVISREKISSPACENVNHKVEPLSLINYFFFCHCGKDFYSYNCSIADEKKERERFATKKMNSVSPFDTTNCFLSCKIIKALWDHLEENHCKNFSTVKPLSLILKWNQNYPSFLVQPWNLFPCCVPIKIFFFFLFCYCQSETFNSNNTNFKGSFSFKFQINLTYFKRTITADYNEE